VLGKRAAAAIFRSALEKGGGANHPRVIAYLRRRGIMIEDLPAGRAPDSLLFSPRCRDWSAELNAEGYWPAMIGRAVSPFDQPHEVTHVHRTFLDPEHPIKRPVTKEWGEARKHRGPKNGHAIRLYPETCPVLEDGTPWPHWKTFGPFPLGILALGEGIETMASVMAATMWAAWACEDTQGLASVIIPEDLFNPFDKDGFLKQEGWWIHTLVIAEDLDGGRAGQKAALDAYERLGELHRRATVRICSLAPELPGGLVEVAGAGELRECRHCKGSGKGAQNRPCYSCGGRGELGFRKGEHRPRLDENGDPMKGVDWNDIILHEGGKAAIVAAFERAVQGPETDLKAARDRSLTWKPATIVTPSGAVIPAAVEGGEGERHASSDPGTPRSAPAIEGGGGGEPVQSGGGWGPPTYGGLVSFYDGFPDPVISPGPLDRARVFLLTECSPPPGSRRFRLLYWGGGWWWYDDVAWRSITEQQLFGMVQHWLAGYHHVKKWKTEKLPEIVKLHPVKRMVMDVIASLASETFASIDEMPAWLPPSLDEDGTPFWGRSVKTWSWSRGRAKYRPGGTSGGLGDPQDYIVFSNGMLDRQALIKQRKVRLLPLTADLFTQAARPYALRAHELQQALDGGPGGAGLTPGLMYGLCPAWWSGLQDAVGDSEPEEKNRRLATLGKMFGDTMGSDRRIEKIFLMLGPQRSYKGCAEEAIKAMSGDDTVAMTSFFDLGGDRFGLAPLVGRNVGIMSDAHVGQMMDATLAVERLKTIRGNGSVSVRDLYQAAKPNVRINIRFWIFANDEPDKLQDNSGALAGSFVIWPTTVSFFGREDPTIKQKIRGEGDGIAVWALYWHAELFAAERPSIEMNDLGKAIAEELADSGSNARLFLKECCICSPERDLPVYDKAAEVDFGAFYEIYVAWCERAGKKPVANNRLLGKLRPLVPGITKLEQRRDADESVDQRKRVLRGLKIVPGIAATLKAEAGSSVPKSGVPTSGGASHYAKPVQDRRQGGDGQRYLRPDEESQLPS